jgi:hypothetical protein
LRNWSGFFHMSLLTSSYHTLPFAESMVVYDTLFALYDDGAKGRGEYED